MENQGKARDVNEAARRLAETLADSYRIVYGQAAESRERQQRRVQEFSDLVANSLREQTEAGRANVEQLSEQAQRQREAGQEFAQESVGAYTRFLDDVFSRYRAGTEQAVGSVQQSARTLTDTPTGLVGTATGAAGATADAMGSAADTAAFPIAGYDEMNVEEVSRPLDGLSDEQLRQVRDYEARNKNRETVLTQIDRKLQ